MIELVGGSLLLAGRTTGEGTIQQLTGTLETKSARGPQGRASQGRDVSAAAPRRVFGRDKFSAVRAEDCVLEWRQSSDHYESVQS